MPIEAINPATGVRISTHEEMTPAQVKDLVAAAHEAFFSWRGTRILDRAASLLRIARFTRVNLDRFATLMTQEMGKPITQARAEIEKCAACAEYFADNGEAFLSREYIRTDATESYVILQPLGVLLAVMPWNFPFWQVFRAAVPAFMVGNAVVLKHASNVPGCALACEEIFHQGGFPDGLFRTVLVGSKRVDELITHPDIKAVTLTGSTPAGRAVASAAGAALKKTVLELGGSDPYIILEDADLAHAAHACATARFINTGQSCIAAKRFIVVQKLLPRFEQVFVQYAKQQKLGDPLQPGTTLGPLARQDLRDQLHRQVQQSVSAGAKLLCGGEIPAGPGAFYPATVLTNVAKGMAVYDEETFGPVAAIIGVKDEAEAIQTANDTPFGLGAAVFTANRERGREVAAQLEAGCVFVNDHVRSDPRLPFGGVKESGYGRELASFGIREFVNVKTVWVK